MKLKSYFLIIYRRKDKIDFETNTETLFPQYYYKQRFPVTQCQPASSEKPQKEVFPFRTKFRHFFLITDPAVDSSHAKKPLGSKLYENDET